jgi:phosphoribosylamine-glycine ligase
MNKPVAIVLGGTAPHIALIEKLKRRNYFVVLIDFYENPPAKSFADKHIQESTLDKNGVLNIAKKQKAELVISTCVDQANLTACYVAEKLNLPRPYSYQTALEVTNKGLMKEQLINNQIPTARHCFVSNYDEALNSGLNFPMVVKPADSNGSAGVRKAENKPELADYLQKAISVSRTNMAIIEEFKSGIEVSIDCFLLNGNVDILLIRQKYNLPGIKGMVLQSPGSFSPALITKHTANKLSTIISSIGKAFSLENTPLLVQALINENEINILEFAPRVGGGLSYRTVFLNTGCDILETAINSFVGIKEKPVYAKPKSFLATIIVYAKPGVFKRIAGMQELIQNDTVLEYHAYKTEGMQIGDDMSTKSRIGAFIVKGNSSQEMITKIKQAVQKIEVYDKLGNEIMLRNIYDDIDSPLFSV